MDDGARGLSGPHHRQITLALDALDRFMPMHVHLTREGLISAFGPTMGKIAAGIRLTGLDFFSIFKIRRPSGIVCMADLVARQGERLHLSFRAGAGADFRGLAIGDADSGIVLNLSFGITVVDAVRNHALTDADFAATDLTVEMLYLVEAKRAVLGELQRLNHRLQGAKSMAELEALTDTLTGLGNRRALDQGLGHAIGAAGPFALMHLDLDRFKMVNDTYGHAAGDHVLRAVADVIRSEVRSDDLVARVGGDEFVILLPGMTDLPRLKLVAERIIAGLAQPVLFNGCTCQIGASIGLTISTLYRQPDADGMLLDADTATYAAKRAGRGQVVAHSVSKQTDQGT
ncbi:MAG: diguanylate cyclase domain-containing protein [Paracoccaceae bacterium]